MPNTGQNAGVPTAPPITIGQLCGAAKTTTLTVSAPNASGNSYPGSNVAFAASTATPSGGVGPYTYAWSYVSGSSFGIDSPTSANTSFRRSGNPPQGASATGTYRVTVTDSIGGNAFKDISVSDSRA